MDRGISLEEVRMIELEKHLAHFSELSKNALYKCLCSLFLKKSVFVKIKTLTGFTHKGSLINVENDCIAISRFDGHIQLCPFLKIGKLEVLNENE